MQLMADRSGSRVKLTNPDRPIYPGSELTKAKLADFYARVMPEMWKFLEDRPIVLLRCPEGGNECFFQRKPMRGLPAELGKNITRGEQIIRLKKPEDIFALVQFNALEIHAWGARLSDIEHPDIMVFDLDPGRGVTGSQLCEAAIELREILKKLRLKSFLKSTGGKGLHVVVPIAPQNTWDEMKDFSHAVAMHLMDQDPKLFTLNMSIAKRRGKIFIDYLRNGRAATSIVNFSARAREGTPVACPLSWKDLSPGFEPRTFQQILKSRSKYMKAWAGFWNLKQKLPKFN